MGEGKTRMIEMVTNQIDPANFVRSQHLKWSIMGCMRLVFLLINSTTSDDGGREIELGHRHDLCELLSVVVVHVESALGKMQVELQMVVNQGLVATQLLFAR